MSLPPGVTPSSPPARCASTGSRARASTRRTRYAGVPLSKFPEDLRTYEHLLWAGRAPTRSSRSGPRPAAARCGSAIGCWPKRRYGRIGRDPHVIWVDVARRARASELDRADREWARTISLVEGDVRDRATVEAVARLVAPGARCFVIEDSAHEYDTTLAALNGFARFVPPGGFFIVEDGCVDVEALRLDAGVAARRAARRCTSGSRPRRAREFRVRRDLELYGISCHPEGFLQRA